MEKNFDVIVIGGGPGGYVCAIRSAQLGLKTACIESRGTLGGTCLNVGCIPSKSLLNLSDNYRKAKKDFSNQGIEISNLKLNIKKMMLSKDKSVQILTKGVEFLFKKNKVTYIKGRGEIFSQNDITVHEGEKKTNYKAKNIVIATGSHPTSLPGVKIDEKNIISSTGALSLPEVPNELVVIGGGYIGLEMGSVWSRLGSKVTVIEYLDHITPGMDREISNEFQKILKKQGINFKLNHKVDSVKIEKNKIVLVATNNKTSEKEKVYCDKVLVSVGRKPYTTGLNLQKIGIKSDNKGVIEVNDKLQTSIENIYAIGDVIKGPMLAHKASHEAKVAAEVVSGMNSHFDVRTIPSVAYTDPEVAWTGITEEQAKIQGISFGKGIFPWSASGRSLSLGRNEGVTKVIFEEGTNRIIGVGIVGPSAGDLISEGVLAIEMGCDADDLSSSIHPHPTLSEP